MSPDPIVQRVLWQIEKRSLAGIKKYGTTLDREDLSVVEWLTHLQEELMDAINYLEVLKERLRQ